MPPKRCQYREGRERCPHPADNPQTGLCRAHELLSVAAAIGAQAASSSTVRRMAEQGRDLLDRFLGGKKVRAADLGDVLREAAANGIREAQGNGWGIGGGYGYGNERGDVGPIPGAGPSQRRQAPPPPPPEPEREYLKELAHARAALGIAPTVPITLELLRTQHRELAKRYHPDKKGGSTAKMQTINAAKDLLEEWLRSR